MGNGGRLASAALGVVVAALAVVGRPGSVRGAEPRPSVPLVLIHGATCGGPEVWGDRRPGARGLYGRLLAAGYQPGRTLFTYDYAGGASVDYAMLAEVGLDRIVSGALEAAGTDVVDIVTFGTGALAARYWVACRAPGGGPAPLRNLVMVAPPNHGQFQADLLKVLYHTDRLVRQPPAGAAGEAAGGGAPAGVAGGSAESFPDPPPFTTEDAYVSRRARDYQRLYGEYVLEARLLGDSAVVPGYDSWLSAERPTLVQSCIYGAETQPSPAGPGLTRAYYEILSLRVGRQLYLARVASAARVPPLPPLEELLSEKWRSELLSYLKTLLLDWGLPKAGRLWTEHRAGFGLSLGEMLTGLEPQSAAVSRLVPTFLAFPGPGATPCLVEAPRRPVLTNGFLFDWERREAAARPAGSRYVAIAGSSPGPLGLTGLDVGPNDLVIEAASALTEPAAPDTFLLGTGLLWNHRLLPRNPRVASAVLAALNESPRGYAEAASGAVGAGPVRSGTGTAGLWQPAYAVLADAGGSSVEPREPMEPEEPTDGSGAVPAASTVMKVDVAVGDPASAELDGLEARVWVAWADGPGSGAPPGRAPVPVQTVVLKPARGAGSDTGVLVGQLTVPSPAPGHRLVLGVRLVPAAQPGRGFLVMGRYLGRQPLVPFSFSVSVSPESGEESGETGAEGDGPPSGAGAEPAQEPGAEPGPDSGSPAGSGDDPTAAGRAEIVPTPKPPLIDVVRVTKLTTDKREDRTFHAGWEWDFGDGERWSDSDPSHTKVTVRHTFTTPGTYRVAALSLGPDGKTLRELHWEVKAARDGSGAVLAAPGGPAAVDADGMTFSFEAETIVEPVVTLSLEGPRKWVTGKPARFTLRADVSWPPRTRRQVLKAYPGWSFDVVWEKPGRFEVRAAVTVKQSYEFPDQRITVYNTYVTVRTVEVLTPGLTE